MALWPTRILGLAFFYAINGKTVGSQFCSENDNEFQNLCETKFNGFVDGGRCFFVSNTPLTWPAGWAYCQKQGGVMAQIQTSSELQKITAYLISRCGPQQDSKYWTWIALRRDPKVTQGRCFLSLEASFWYDAPDKPNPQLSAGQTWIRERRCDDALGSRGADQCTNLWSGFSKFADWRCESAQPVLCQLTNPSQNFVEIIGVCLDETPIEQFPSAAIDDCAKSCGKRSWCHSFNFVASANSCELFTWSVYDRPKMKVNSDCHHYTAGTGDSF